MFYTLLMCAILAGFGDSDVISKIFEEARRNFVFANDIHQSEKTPLLYEFYDDNNRVWLYSVDENGVVGEPLPCFVLNKVEDYDDRTGVLTMFSGGYEVESDSLITVSHDVRHLRFKDSLLLKEEAITYVYLLKDNHFSEVKGDTVVKFEIDNIEKYYGGSTSIAKENNISQEASAEEDELVLAHFPGGAQALLGYIESELKYPEEANGAQGKAKCEFVVDKEGNIKHVRIVKSSGNEYLDREAIRVISNMPKWIPTTSKSGETSSQGFTLPITFRIRKEDDI